MWLSRSIAYVAIESVASRKVHEGLACRSGGTVLGAMLVAVATAKARQDGSKNVALLEPAFGLTAALEIDRAADPDQAETDPAGEFMMDLGRSDSATYNEEFYPRQCGRPGREKEATRADHAPVLPWAYTK